MRKNKGFLELRRLEAARDIAEQLSQSGNKVMLDSSTLLLDGACDSFTVTSLNIANDIYVPDSHGRGRERLAQGHEVIIIVLNRVASSVVLYYTPTQTALLQGLLKVLHITIL
jgi:hypothetical protein